LQVLYLAKTLCNYWLCCFSPARRALAMVVLEPARRAADIGA
jgi:hypothetical protein